jgi:PPK2 family polyphosphate:nucleotide phosphotransferase
MAKPRQTKIKKAGHLLAKGKSGKQIISDSGKKELIQRSKNFCTPYVVEDRKNFRLKDCVTQAKSNLDPVDKPLINQMLQQGVETLAAMQDILYAQDKWSLLLIFQAMDAAGKDGAIKHVMSGINPQGCQVTSFKAPSAEELDHDFLWRCIKQLPERGRIGIFNRSYYEEVLVVRVHEEILRAQKLDEKLITEDIWEERFKDIRNFEKYLYRNGTIVVKFFLNVSKNEQKKRFIERIDNPDKNWKFSTADAKERTYWKDYMHAYEEMIRKTSTKKAPWYVVPADNKSYARIVIASAVINALEALDLKYPKLNKEKIEELKAVRKILMEEE